MTTQEDFQIKKWWVWLWIATLFVGSVMACLVTQLGVLQPAYTLDTSDLEEVFLLMIVPFLIGIATGIYYQRRE